MCTLKISLDASFFEKRRLKFTAEGGAEDLHLLSVTFL